MKNEFFNNTTNVQLFKKLVNTAKSGDFSSLQEPIKSIFRDELEKVRNYINKVIKQPAYISKVRKRYPNETLSSVEERLLKEIFKSTGLQDTPGHPDLTNFTNSHIIKNLDYYKFLWILGDIYAALRTIVSLRKNITDVLIQPLEYVQEYHKSFGFDIFNVFNPNIQRSLLYNIVDVIKKKGTIYGFKQLLENLGILNFGIAGYWTDLDNDDNTYKLFPKLITKYGNPLIINLDLLTKNIDDIEDAHWFIKNSDLHTLNSSGKVWFPSKSPYIALFLSLNLADFTTMMFNVILGSIFVTAAIMRNEITTNTRNIPLTSYGNNVSITELVFGITWFFNKLYGLTPFVSPNHQYIYGYNGPLTDDSGQPIDDDTLTAEIIQKWLSVYGTKPSNYDEKWEKINTFRTWFYYSPPYTLIDNIIPTVEEWLQTHNSNFYEFLNLKQLAGDIINPLDEMAQALEIYIYDLTNMLFPFRQSIFGFGDRSILRQSIEKIFEWVKPYHVKLLELLFTFSINDPVGDSLFVRDKDILFLIEKRLLDPLGCLYDIGGIYTTSNWSYDACKRPNDYIMYFNIYKTIIDHLDGIRYDTGKFYDSGYTYDYFSDLSDLTNIITYKQITTPLSFNHIERFYISLKSFYDNLTETESIYLNIGKYQEDTIPVYNQILLNISKHEQTEINLNDRVNKIINKVINEQQDTSDDVYIIITKPFTDSISVDDSNITVTVS